MHDDCCASDTNDCDDESSLPPRRQVELHRERLRWKTLDPEYSELDCDGLDSAIEVDDALFDNDDHRAHAAYCASIATQLMHVDPALIDGWFDKARAFLLPNHDDCEPG